MGQRIEIHEQEPSRKVIKRGTPQERMLTEYTGWIWLDNKQPYPKECTVTVWPDRTTGEIVEFTPGEYLAESVVSGVDRFGSFLYRTEYKRVGDLKKTA